MEMKHFLPSEDDPSTTDLRHAIQKLELFAVQNEAEPVPHVGHFEKDCFVTYDKTPLQKTMELAKSFIAVTFSDKARSENDKKRTHIHDQLLEAIDVVKSHYFLIENKLKKGNPSEQKLAAYATSTIQRFNAIIDQANRMPTSWRERMVRLAYQHSGLSLEEKLHKIDLPQPAAVELGMPLDAASDLNENKLFWRRFHINESSASSKKIATLFPREIATDGHKISTREVDVFCMKALRMLNNHGIPFASISDVVSSIRGTPIHVQPDITQQDASSPVISLFQILTPFPGEIVELKGSFQRFPTTKANSIPIPESFHLFSRSVQTGFPHPSQHNGWALADQLIPACPHRLDQLPFFVKLLNNKKEIAQALLPQGRLINTARALHKLKRESFRKNSNRLLLLHKALTNAMLKCAQDSGIQTNPKEEIEQFHNILADHTNPFELLIETNQLIIEYFIANPYAKLQEAWAGRSHSGLHSKDPSISYAAARSIIQNEISNNAQKLIAAQFEQSKEAKVKAIENYILGMGDVIGSPCAAILLQLSSEGMGFAPPMLNDYEQRMQVAVYKQLYEFLEELTLAESQPQSLERIELNLENQLMSDIGIFEATCFDAIRHPTASVINEIEIYFNSRYYYLINRQ
jgi:hypothetical protein